MTSEQPAGWYPDPSGKPGMERYWSGTMWATNARPVSSPSPQRADRQKVRVGAWNRLMIIVGTSVVILVAGTLFLDSLGVTSASRSQPGQLVTAAPSTTAIPSTLTVTISSSAPGGVADITVDNGSQESQDLYQTLPYTSQIPTNGQVVVVSAMSEFGGNVTCAISSGGSPLVTNTSVGYLSTVTCTVP